MSLPKVITALRENKSPEIVYANFYIASTWTVGGLFIGKTDDLSKVTTNDSLSVDTYYLGGPHVGDAKPCMWATASLGITSSTVPTLVTNDADYLYFVIRNSSSHKYYLVQFNNQSAGFVPEDYLGLVELFTFSDTETVTLYASEIDSVSGNLTIWYGKRISSSGEVNYDLEPVYQVVVSSARSVLSTTDIAVLPKCSAGPIYYGQNYSNCLNTWLWVFIPDDIDDNLDVYIQFAHPNLDYPYLFGEVHSLVYDREMQISTGAVFTVPYVTAQIATYLAQYSAEYAWDARPGNVVYGTQQYGYACGIRMKFVYKGNTYYSQEGGILESYSDWSGNVQFMGFAWSGAAITFTNTIYYPSTTAVADANGLYMAGTLGTLTNYEVSQYDFYSDYDSGIFSLDKADLSGVTLLHEWTTAEYSYDRYRADIIDGHQYWQFYDTATYTARILTNAGGSWAIYTLKDGDGVDLYLYSLDFGSGDRRPVRDCNGTPIFIGRGKSVTNEIGYPICLVELGSTASGLYSSVDDLQPYPGFPEYYIGLLSSGTISFAPDTSHAWFVSDRDVEGALKTYLVEVPRVASIHSFRYEGKFRMCKVP